MPLVAMRADWLANIVGHLNKIPDLAERHTCTNLACLTAELYKDGHDKNIFHGISIKIDVFHGSSPHAPYSPRANIFETQFHSHVAASMYGTVVFNAYADGPYQNDV